MLVDPHEVNGVKTDLCLRFGAQNDKIFTLRQAAWETEISGIVFLCFGAMMGAVQVRDSKESVG